MSYARLQDQLAKREQDYATLVTTYKQEFDKCVKLEAENAALCRRISAMQEALGFHITDGMDVTEAELLKMCADLRQRADKET